MKNLIGALVIGIGLLSIGCQLEGHVPAEIVTMEQSQPAGGEESLRARIDYDIGRLEISSDQAENMYALNLEYDKARYEPRVSYETDGGREGLLEVELDTTRKLGFGNHGKTNILDLNLTNGVPVSLKINSGVGESRLSLSGMQLTNLDLSAGVGGTKITTYEPNAVACNRIHLENGVGSMEAVGLGHLNFESFHFEGGVGGADLDFSGEWQRDAQIRIEVGVGGVTVRMPRTVGVVVDADKNFLSGLHLDGFVKRGSEYYSESYDEAEIRIEVRVSTGIGGFKFSWL
jgi:hypothetical protein